MILSKTVPSSLKKAYALARTVHTFHAFVHMQCGVHVFQPSIVYSLSAIPEYSFDPVLLHGACVHFVRAAVRARARAPLHPRVCLFV